MQRIIIPFHPGARTRLWARASAALATLAMLACSLPGQVPAAPHQPPHRARVPPDDLDGRELRDVELVQQVSPTVVTIQAVTASWEAGSRALHQVVGTGVLIEPDGHVLTAAHVVEGAESITVATHDGVPRAAVLEFTEPGADIALLRLAEPAGDLPRAALGNSDRLAVGQWVYVIGHPQGLRDSFSAGRVSAFRDFAQLYDGTILAEFIQTDAAINSGNSGGPLFDSHGRVIGIASRILTQSGGSEGLGFAVTINTVKLLLALEERAWTGFRGIFLDHDQLATLFHLEREGGLLVQTVARGSPAEAAGLRGGTIPAVIGGQQMLLGGDLLLEFGGQRACHGGCLVGAHDRILERSHVDVVYLRSGVQQSTVIDTSRTRRSFLAGTPR